MSDQEIIDSILKGDKEAYRMVVDKYRSVILGTIYNMIGFVVEADDVAQEVFIRFYNSIGNFKGDASLKTYLTKIAINLSLNELKRRNKRYFESIDDVDQNDLGQTKSNDENMEQKDLIHKALLKIEPTYRTVINLRLIQEFSTKETAEILNIPQGTVLSRLSRAQQKLKANLDEMIGEKYG